METMNARSAQSSRSTSNSSSDQASNSSAGWERFLPPRPLRVLLVEEDIATRQIVGALLSKCGYEVRPSADSVTAWNLLENSPTKFDLILADAFLPDISGNDLLSKIMSHESHKDIPVIMMSSQDSLDVVFKCLLRGAKDFLVKPLRKNELRNLWQHVWRKNRESSRIENGKSARGHKRKATRISMSSSGGNSSDGFSISGGTATQVVNSEAVQSQKEDKASHREAIIDQDTLKCEFGSRTLEEKEEYSSNSDDKEDSERSAKAIDLIGTMTEHPIFDRSQPNSESEKSVLTRSHQSLPVLELTLRTCAKQQTQTDHNGQTSVQQSYCSAFSKYISNVTSPQHQSIFRSVVSLPSDHSSHRGGIDGSSGASTLHFPQAIHFSHAGKQGASALSLIASSSDENMRQPPIHEKSLSSFRTPSMNSTTMNGSNHPSNNKIPLNGSENGDCGPGDAQSMDQPSAHPCPSVNTDNVELNQRNIHLHQSATVVDGASKIENNASVHEMPSHMMASSGGSNLCEDYRTGKSVNYGGSGNWGGNFGGGSEENSMADCSRPTPNTISEDLEQLKANDYRTAFRQAALNKFRQKRKVRCFEKKVRYQTRKKLAEQRPRVKGQFVRQTAYNAVTLLQPDA